MGKGKKKSSTPKTPEQQKAARLMSAKKQGKKLTKQLKPIVEEQLADMIPDDLKGTLIKKGVEIVNEAIENPTGTAASVYHESKKVIPAAKIVGRTGMDVVGSMINPMAWDEYAGPSVGHDIVNAEVEVELNKRLRGERDRFRENRKREKAKFDAQWKQMIPNPTRQELEDKAKQDKEWKKQYKKDKKELYNTLYSKENKQNIRRVIQQEKIAEANKPTQPIATMDELIKAKDKEVKQTRTEETTKIIKNAGDNLVFEGIDDQVRKWMNINPKVNPTESALYDYAGGTQIRQFLKNIKDVSGNSTQGWSKLKDIDWSKGVGAAAEVIGNLQRDEEGSRWSPLVTAGIGAAKKFLGVTNPILGIAMDVGGVLATTKLGRNAVKWVGEKAMGLGRNVINKVKSRNLATMHSEGVIPIVSPKKEEPIVQKPIDYSGVNIPNILLPQESNAAYMMRMTGGMNVGPANANVVTYSGYKKPQYEKVQNRVMLAPPRISSKRGKVRVRRRR